MINVGQSCNKRLGYITIQYTAIYTLKKYAHCGGKKRDGCFQWLATGNCIKPLTMKELPINSLTLTKYYILH